MTDRRGEERRRDRPVPVLAGDPDQPVEEGEERCQRRDLQQVHEALLALEHIPGRVDDLARDRDPDDDPRPPRYQTTFASSASSATRRAGAWSARCLLAAGQLSGRSARGSRRPQLVQDDAVLRRDLPDPSGVPSTARRSGSGDARPKAGRREQVTQAFGSAGVRTRTASAPRAVSSSRSRARRDALLDDRDVVHRLRDLGEHVARDEDRAPLRAERPEQVAQPADPLRIETVRRFVEDENVWIAEERTGKLSRCRIPKEYVSPCCAPTARA